MLDGSERFATLKTLPTLHRGVSLRRYLAGPVSFGLTLGLAVVAVMLEGGSLDVFPTMSLIAWGGAVALAAVTLKLGWPVFHVGAAGLLMVASALLLGTSYWPLPLAAAVGTMAMARFASVGFASRWLSRAVGLAGAGGLVWAIYGYATGSGSFGGSDALDLGVAALALVVIAVMGFWHPADDEE